MAGEAMDPYADDTDGIGTDAANARTAALVVRARSGEERAFGELYDVWFDRVHDLACRITGDRSTGAEVAQDTFLQAWRSLDTVRDPQVFGGWLLRIARNTALNRRRVEARTTAVDSEGMAVIEGLGASSVGAPAGFGVGVEERVARAVDPSAAVADADVVALVRDAVAAMSGRDAEVLDLGLRLGLSPAEIGEAIGLNRNAANQAVHRARRGLRKAVEARVLWRGSRPACPELDATLRKAGVDAFGSTAVPIADAHAARCERCGERRRLRLEPAALFGAIPLVAAPVLLKAKVAAALAAEGVPMTGSSHGGAAAPHANVGPDTSVPGSPTADGLVPVARATTDRPRKRNGGRMRLLAMSTAAAVVLVAVIVAIATAAGNGGDTVTMAPSDASKSVGTPAPSTVLVTPSSTTSAAPIEAAATTGPALAPAPTRPPVVAPPPAEPAPTTTPEAPPETTTTVPRPPPVETTLTMTPNSRARPWYRDSSAPRLVWTTSGAATVTVEGPGFAATTSTGDVPVCPNGTPEWSFCLPNPATYEYVLTARDAGGAVIARRTATLMVP